MEKIVRTGLDIEKAQTIQAEYHPIRDWVNDEAGYVLIRILRDQQKIQIGFCPKLNKMSLYVEGKTGTEVYNTFVKHAPTLRPEHYAYIGKELEKATLALQYDLVYVQDDALDLHKKYVPEQKDQATDKKVAQALNTKVRQ